MQHDKYLTISAYFATFFSNLSVSDITAKNEEQVKYLSILQVKTVQLLINCCYIMMNSFSYKLSH